jgi:hypothetical protein
MMGTCRGWRLENVLEDAKSRKKPRAKEFFFETTGQRRLLFWRKRTQRQKGKCDSKHAVLLQSYTYDLHV